MKALRKFSPSSILVFHGPKKGAGRAIAEGTRHYHSSLLGESDPLVQMTKKALEEGTIPEYPWESKKGIIEASLFQSSSRHQLFQTIFGNQGLKRQHLDRLGTVFEEFLTNAFYHAYREDQGNEKYPRDKKVRLTAEEAVRFSYRVDSEGTFLSIEDQGGTLKFEDVQKAFLRGYGKPGLIEDKEGGAGLGLYLAFGALTHLKIEVNTGRYSRLSAWLSNKSEADACFYTFNFFERGK